uniref:IgGFc-binding protein N-terminal domain-containing protein n=1 Tax=Biomphalaria glabrata TaxID=6526 RepID=A0A2C9LVR2_BIOGL
MIDCLRTCNRKALNDGTLNLCLIGWVKVFANKTSRYLNTRSKTVAWFCGSTVIGEKPIGIVTGNCRSRNDGMVCQSEEREEENYILKDYISYINASHGVLVLYVQSAKTKVGGPSFLQIIPMELFYFKYMIMTPQYNASTLDYIVLVVKAKWVDSILMENHNPNISLPDFQLGRKTIIFSVRGKDTWKVYIGQIDKNSIFVVLSTRGNFGCYQYGVGYSTSYMHSSGFISSPINNDIQSCAQTRVRMAAVDLIDNDCDGQIDEEVANGVGRRRFGSLKVPLVNM